MMNVATYMDVEEIHELIREIDLTEDVVFVDVNYALFYAQDLQRTLALNKKMVRCHTRLDKQVACVEGLGKDSLVVAFSVNLGFGIHWNDVYKALLKCPCKKILVSSEPFAGKTCFDRIISVDKSGQQPVSPKYGMMYYMEAVISAYYQMKSEI